MVSAELTTGNLFSKELMMIGGTTEQDRDHEAHAHTGLAEGTHPSLVRL